MQTPDMIFGTLNIVCGLMFILIGIPLATRKVPMNRYYGFRFPKAFISDKNWYAINQFGGKQLLRWSVFLILIGILYFIFPIAEPRNEIAITVAAVAPIVVCSAAAIFKTLIYARSL